MTDGNTPRLDTYLAAQRMQDEFYGFSAGEIERMPMDVYQRLRARAGLPEVDPYRDAYAAYEPPGTPMTLPAPEAAQVNADAVQGIDPNSDEYFLAWRQNRVSDGEGRGIFDSVGSQSAAYRQATARQAGRTAYSQGNVVEPPRIEGRYVRQDDMRDTRSAAQRFSTPGNAFGL
jgi:hypothetical protein